jgi:DNA-binding transcriptional LysR family regulator
LPNRRARSRNQSPPVVPDLSARELRAIAAIADTGSFGSASQQLKLSTPTISRLVKHVERVVGVTLFERSTRRVDITPAGRHFVDIAHRLLGDLQFSMQHLGDVSNEQRGQVVISSVANFSRQTLSQVVGDYRKTRPGVHVHIRHGKFADVLEDVESGVSDFGVTYVDTLPDTVQHIKLRREPLCVALPPGHPLSTRREVGLHELHNQPLISLPPDANIRRHVDSAAAAAGIWLQHAVVVPGLADLLPFVEAGVGLGIAPAGQLPAGVPSKIALRPLAHPALTVQVGILVLRTRHMAPVVAGLLRLLIERVRGKSARITLE